MCYLYLIVNIILLLYNKVFIMAKQK